MKHDDVTIGVQNAAFFRNKKGTIDKTFCSVFGFPCKNLTFKWQFFPISDVVYFVCYW